MSGNNFIESKGFLVFSMLKDDIFFLVAGRLLLPEKTEAILWDMDGVLIDSLGFDFDICNLLAARYFGSHVKIPHAFIRSVFAYHPPEFRKRILAFLQDNFDVPCDQATYVEILRRYEEKRQSRLFELNPGIREVLTVAHRGQIKMAVVSNNPTKDVEELLQRCGIASFFECIVGYDLEACAKKPAPDTYLLAAKKLGISPENCVVVEDSLIGIEAGFRAGSHTVAVATGGTPFAVLSESSHSHQTYSDFTPAQCDMRFGDVRHKSIVTPNDFVSHMVEHIAWRLGMQIHLHWNNDVWYALGMMIGKRLLLLQPQKDVAVVLGMIDDGSVEVVLDRSTSHPGVTFDEVPAVDLAWFLSLRCEQMVSGEGLQMLMLGLAESLGAEIRITLCSAEDPHHTWEGVFRAIGMALSQWAFTGSTVPLEEATSFRHPAGGHLDVVEKSLERSHVIRKTAESDLSVVVDFSQKGASFFRFDVADSIQVDRLPDLLGRLAYEAGFSLHVDFHALALSSSHVVLEDVGLALGKALLEILKLRMDAWGANGSGSSLQTLEEVAQAPIRLGLSVEGRKFCLFVPLHDAYATLRRTFLVGQSVFDTLRSEDLDDFMDGLAGGLSCSIVVHFKEIPPPEQGWIQVFEHLGKALKSAFTANPSRKGVPPGVKATLV